MIRKLLYRAHGALTIRMFERDPPKLGPLETAALWLVRQGLDVIEMRDMRKYDKSWGR